ncbi:KilA-N domain-containing protein [Acidithiobacillus thiooxidans]|uniref:KilA-N domain-containing protein n=1 Tax=Acidithiobacillus thiooxidans TaxID=930 RepID=UPI0028591632|nr:KilA-N domain-containing protein [Acidithiobacillus thiooxidans]MDR7927360.1 KilA-N domain-containing protein [Acidithiobacillus thiooxidans]
MKKKPTDARITVRGSEIAVIRRGDEDYISLTDIAKSRSPDHPDDLIRNWLRNRNTLELLGIWEQLHNDSFNPVEFDGIKKQAGLNSFTLTPKQWIDKTAAIGIESRAGRYGGTYAHTDVAFEFASWVSVEFKLYLIMEFQRLKEDENRRLSLAWNLNRTLAKINYRLHTDAIQAHLIPAEVTPKQASITYANEADLLNVALFGQTAREWRDTNPDKDGNMRDHASLEQLLVLANLENMNAEFIHMELPQSDRIKRLNAIAIRQMQTLTARTVEQLKGGAT